MSVPDIRRGVKPELEPGSTPKAGPFITLLTVPKQPAVQRRSSPTTSLPRTLDEMSIGSHMAGQTDKERQDVRMEIPARPSVDETSEKQPAQLDLSDDVALRPKLSPESSTSLPGNPTDTRPTTLLRSHTIGPVGHRQLRDRLSEPPSTADEILQDKRDGSFLVRYSSERGHYVLSFRAKGETIHMKIVESRRSQFGSIVYSLGFGDDFCESIIQLVKHFGQRHDRPPLLHPVRR
ncbi:hypothetical protein BaRGS_00018744 [Batillaria attramentaria]|uniref:SH2 domain-containing protein n=1 Tax=Batillaria attramentaria TaxID=370345 RepID=A0ABD0KT11_9CAEN